MEHAKFAPFRCEDMRILIEFSEVSSATRLYEIDQIKDKESTVPVRVALVTKHPSLAADYRPRVENDQLTEAQKAAHQQLNTFRILLRNVAACNSNATHGIHPKMRTRFNHPESPTEHNVSSKDFGMAIMELAKEVREYSQNLMVLADQMVDDRKRDIQNCMDCARFAEPRKPWASETTGGNHGRSPIALWGAALLGVTFHVSLFCFLFVKSNFLGTGPEKFLSKIY